MSIEIREVRVESDDYQRYFNQSPQATIFHHEDFLTLLDDHSEAELKILAGFKGQEPVGVFPLFVDETLNLSRVYSPPSSFGIPYMGPILLNFGKLKKRKAEKRYKRFITGCINWVNKKIAPTHARNLTVVDQNDSRPFHWNGYHPTPKYTYHVDMEQGIEGLKKSFTRELRRQIRRYSNSEFDHSINISAQGKNKIDFIYNEIESRYEAQGRSYPIELEYLKNVCSQLPDECVEIYTGKVDGKLVAGMIILEDTNKRYFWQGGGKPDISVPINDLLHWEIIKEGVTSGKSYYDLCGANTERLCEYKAKFNPELRTYYEVELDSAISKIYKLIQ